MIVVFALLYCAIIVCQYGRLAVCSVRSVRNGVLKKMAMKYISKRVMDSYKISKLEDESLDEYLCRKLGVPVKKKLKHRLMALKPNDMTIIERSEFAVKSIENAMAKLKDAGYQFHLSWSHDVFYVRRMK